MRKGYYKILIVLMSIALLGLIIIQVYWLKKAFESSREQFTGRVYSALLAAADEIRQDELFYYHKTFEPSSKKLESLKNKPEAIVANTIIDSASSTNIIITRYILEQSMIPLPTNSKDTLRSADLYKSESVYQIPKDSAIQGKKLEPLNFDIENKFRNATFNIERFARLDADNKPIKDRVNLRKLQKEVNKQLKIRGIDEKPRLAVVDAEKKVTSIVDSSYLQDDKNIAVPLFRNSTDSISFYMSAYMPSRTNAIISPIAPVFILTLVFTLLIIGVFSMAIYYMQFQRKVAEIKTDFINNMSHEFKTPLATISVATDALRNKKISGHPEKVEHYAQLIKKENKRMHQQVEMVLRMSKLERNQIEINKEIIDLHDILMDCRDSIHLQVEAKNGVISTDFAAKNHHISADSVHLRNMIMNVLDNANKYSPEKPSIQMATYNDDHDRVVLSVKDEGLGMSKLAQKRIFEQFFREETGNVHNVKGQGLGLAYVKKLIEMHQGEIWVKSTKGEGSQFFMAFPVNNNN